MYKSVEESTKTNLHQILYVMLICINVCSYIIVSANFNKIAFIDKSLWMSSITRVSIICCIILLILNQRFHLRKLIIISIVSVLVLVVTLMSNNLGFAQVYFFVISFPTGLKARYIAKWQSYTFFTTITYVHLMNAIGIIPSSDDIRMSSIRYSGGFTSANAFANTVLLALIAYAFYKQDKWRIKHTTLCAILVGYVFHLTNSRMSLFVSIILLLVMTMWSVFRYKPGKGYYLFSKYSFLFGSLISLLITDMFSKGYFYEHLSSLNRILSYRLSFMSRYFADPGVSLFGGVLDLVSKAQSIATGEKWSGLDNSYLFIMLSWGIVGFAVIAGLMLILGKYFQVGLNQYGALCILLYSIIGLTENYLMIVPYNLCILLIAEMLSEAKWSLMSLIRITSKKQRKLQNG